MTSSPTILWFRLDLRLEDNPALEAALRRGAPILPIFIWAPGEEGEWAPGAASRWWLHQSLASLNGALGKLGSKLHLLQGESRGLLLKCVEETSAGAVFWNRRYEPDLLRRDTEIEQVLRAKGLVVETFNSALLFQPWELKTLGGGPYRVFTPFWKSLRKAPEPSHPIRGPKQINASSFKLPSLKLQELHLEPAVDWASGMREAWQPGEAGAQSELDRFLGTALTEYLDARDHPARNATSRLSPHLHFGEIGPRQVWHAVRQFSVHDRRPGVERNSEGFLRELAWREFAHHLLYHFPHTADRPLRPEFERFPWRNDPDRLKSWREGKTGYPLLDAGMRQLWATGWMHNRVRMVAASFLVKDLLIPWQEGTRWFWDTLVDADLANNTLGWQWTAGCGADASPFFRIFNPSAQGEKFDAAGEYIRTWVPELTKIPDQNIHRPWEASTEVLARAGVILGKNYPRPIIDHGEARGLALRSLGAIKKNNL